MITKKQFPEHIIDKIVELYTNDIKIDEIARQLNMGGYNVRRCLIKRNITLKGKKFATLKWKHLDNILNKDYVIKKYNELMTIAELAKHFECGVNLIQAVFKFHNIKSLEFHQIRELRLQNERKIPLTEENVIKAYTEDFMTITEMETKFRTSHTTINNILKKHNISREYFMVCNNNEKKMSLLDKEKLNEIRQNFSKLKEAATYLGCTGALLQKQLKKFGLKPFSKTESRKKYMINYIQQELPGYKIINYDENEKRFVLIHEACNKEFDLAHCTVTSYKLGNHNKERLCPHCFHRKASSHDENKIKEFLLELNISFTPNTRSLLRNRELDIVIDSHKVAIEYCGLYWHSDIYKDKTYHLDKLNRCNENGYKLITIFEDEWLNKPDIVMSKLKHILGYSNNKIYARKCIIKDIDSKTRNIFLDKHHIQGNDKANYSYGLFHDNELVAVASFSKLNIAKGQHNQEGTYELSRYASSTHVIGGLGKLLSHFEKSVHPKKLITYADRRWSEGNIYEKLNFVKEKVTAPNYWYMDKRLKKRIHRFNYRKSILKKNYPEVYNYNLTELQITNLLDIRHIWDCGNIKYVKIYETSQA